MDQPCLPVFRHSNLFRDRAPLQLGCDSPASVSWPLQGNLLDPLLQLDDFWLRLRPAKEPLIARLADLGQLVETPHRQPRSRLDLPLHGFVEGAPVVAARSRRCSSRRCKARHKKSISSACGQPCAPTRPPGPAPPASARLRQKRARPAAETRDVSDTNRWGSLPTPARTMAPLRRG
jgi:hypothetical protein